MDDIRFIGGCGCGELRYEGSSPPLESGYCHCRLCQRTSAAPVLAFASFPVDQFRYSKGKPAIYRSSRHGHREFCASCGTQIAYRDSQDAKTVDVNAASLDEPSTISPAFHIHCESRINWFEIDDDLPRYQKGKSNRPE